MTTDRFDELQDGRKLTIKRADGGLLLTIATMHRMETVPLTEERTDDLARWLGGADDPVSVPKETFDAMWTEIMASRERRDMEDEPNEPEGWRTMEWGEVVEAVDLARAGQLAEANRTGQAMGSRIGQELSEERRIAAERYMRERNEAVVERDEWKAIATSTEETLKQQQGAKARTVEPDVAAQLERLKAMPSGHVDADPMRRLSTTDLDQVPPVDDDAVDRALMAGWAERTAAETPRAPTEPAAGYVVDVDPFSPQGSGFNPRAVFPPQVAPGMQGAIDATHAHSAIVLASAKEGTPAPEPEDRSEPPAWADVEGDPTSGFDLIERNGGTVVTGNIDRRALVEWAWGMHDTVRGTPGSTEPTPSTASVDPQLLAAAFKDGQGAATRRIVAHLCKPHSHPDAGDEIRRGCHLRSEGSTEPCSNCSGKGWTADEERLRFIYCECPKGVQRRQADESS